MPTVIFCLLVLSKCRMLHLKFHCLPYILALTKPENKFVTLCNAFSFLADSVIKVRKLICPLLSVIAALILF